MLAAFKPEQAYIILVANLRELDGLKVTLTTISQMDNLIWLWRWALLGNHPTIALSCLRAVGLFHLIWSRITDGIALSYQLGELLG